MTARPRRSLGQRIDAWLTRTYVLGPSRQQPPPAGPIAPEPRAAHPARLAQAAFVAFAVVLPVAVAVLLIPWRTTLTASTQTLVMVLPVVAVAVAAHRTAALIAGVAAALAYDILLTEPYCSLVIDTAEDIEAALVLGLIGVIVGSVVARELDARIRAASRAEELTALAGTASAAATGRQDHLVTAAARAIVATLGARSCDWSPGFHGQIGHVMTREGFFPNWSGASLPEGTVELPVRYADRELGRLLVRTGSDEPVSAEERRTAIAIADVFAAGLPR